MRADQSSVTAESGCTACDKTWNGTTAVAQAARHAEHHGHPTWANQTIYSTWRGGHRPGTGKQLTLT